MISTRLRFLLSFLVVWCLQSSVCAQTITPATQRDIGKTLKAYANLFGCNFSYDPKNIVEYLADDDSTEDEVALIRLDVGCQGGTATTSSLLVVMNNRSGKKRYVRPDISMPMAKAATIPAFVQKIEIREGKLRYSGVRPGGEDSSCCPSIPVSGTVELVRSPHPQKGLVGSVYSWNFVADK